MSFIRTTADSISSGGTVTGNLTVDADLTVTGDSNVTLDEVISGTLTSGALTISSGLTTTGAVLTLATKEPTVVANDILGRIDFQAPLDTGADSDLVGASIHALATGTFSDTVNATDLIFSTGASETATEKMRISSGGDVIFSGGNIKTDTNSRIFPSTGTSATSTVFGKLAGNALAAGGINNTLIGENAGKTLTTGDYNTVIGYNAMPTGTTGLGYNVVMLCKVVQAVEQFTLVIQHLDI